MLYFYDPQAHRHEKEINIAGYIMALMIAVGIGAFFTTSPCLTEKTETHARDAFYFGLLFDGVLGLLITVVIISVSLWFKSYLASGSSAPSSC